MTRIQQAELEQLQRRRRGAKDELLWLKQMCRLRKRLNAYKLSGLALTSYLHDLTDANYTFDDSWKLKPQAHSVKQRTVDLQGRTSYILIQRAGRVLELVS